MMKKRLICTLAALAIFIGTCPQAGAAWVGRLPRDQDWQLELTGATNSTYSLTVYYLDARGSEVIGIMTVAGTDPVTQTFPKPGRSVKRIVIEVDPTPGSQCAIRINQGSSITIDDPSGVRLVLDVV
jgi:hypothetical protein